MRAVFLGLLRHEADVGHGAHGLRVEVAVPFAEVDHLLVDAGEGRLRHHGLAVVRLAVGAPHLAAAADHGRHRSIDDDVIGRMEVGDALRRIHHRQARAVLLAGMQVALDLVAQRLGQGLDLVVQVDHAVVHVDADFLEQPGVLFEGFLVVDPDAMAEDDRVRDLHHGRLDVQREQHAGLAAILQLAFVELAQRLLAHEHAVDDFAGQQAELGLEHDGLAAFGDELHLDVARAVERHRLLAVVEVAVVHVRDMGLRPLLPLAHRMRVLARVFLDGARRAAVGIAFAQHRVDRTADALAVAGLEFLLLVALRVFRVVGNLVAFGLQFAHAGHQLGDRGADVGQLDDVGVGVVGQAPQFTQVIRDFLFGGETPGEFGKHPGRHRDVAADHVHPGGRGEGLDDGQEGIRRQQRRLVGKRVDDLRFACCHCCPLVIGL